MSQQHLETYLNYYQLQVDQNNIVFIQQQDTEHPQHIDSVAKLEAFSYLLLTQLQQDNVNGVIYNVPTIDTPQIYASLIDICCVQYQEDIISRIYQNIAQLIRHDKPLIALLTSPCHDLSLSTALWAKERLALPSVNIRFEDTKYGILGGFGINSIVTKISTPEVSIPFLLQQISYSAREAWHHSLIHTIVEEEEMLLPQAKLLIAKKQYRSTHPRFTSIQQKQMDEAKNNIRKYTHRQPQGLHYALENIQFAHDNALSKTLLHERQLYLKLWLDPTTTAYLRTQYFGIKEALQKATRSTLPHYNLHRLAILGAGMMGAGIAFEAAKSGINVLLKDSLLEKAEHGKSYSQRVSNKLIQQQRITLAQQKQLLDRIIPTDKIEDLQGVDLIIEAINEDKELKAAVSAESAHYLQQGGFFASNTTSIPISSLASAVADPTIFIGMHFFSPVDRMPLVEIIKGKETAEETVKKALYVATQLGKIPIVVNDGPAFFTSRIFFNYLLEAITMVLEGIDPQQIEEQAKDAGYAASPLAVLDEISVPLMVQVYNQLPEMHASQKRAHTLLTEMIAIGRIGRKANAGFYTYHTESKTLWNNTLITNTAKAVPPSHIKQRLLHVVALDSYRCLESDIVQQPIDADLGSILGLGYPALTGGVISYIDLVGIAQFVRDCKSYESFGEQWQLSDRLIDLAEQHFSFYTGLTSNWNKE